MVEFGFGALFDDHAPQRYLGIAGIGETFDWNPLLTVTVCCGTTWPVVAPHAVNINNKTEHEAMNFNTSEQFLHIIYLYYESEIFHKYKFGFLDITTYSEARLTQFGTNGKVIVTYQDEKQHATS